MTEEKNTRYDDATLELVDAFESGAKKERAAIVAFLRDQIFNCTFESIPSAIEAGEHWK